MKKKINSSLILTILISLFFVNIKADSSMRKCMLLPIRDSVDGAIAFKVFERIEDYLKEGEWCYYQSNSEILNIFSNYKKNLDNVLNNKNVLKIVSEKTKSGSLIQVKIINQIKGADIILKIFGANGEDIYFKREISLDNDDYTVIAQTVQNWLDIYEKSIPYDGRIIGVLGTQFTVDMGKSRGSLSGTEVILSRSIRKKRHPLLKEIVDWETIKIGSGKIIHSSKNQSQGNVLQYDTQKKMKIDDWVILKKTTKNNYIAKQKFGEKNDHEFGKLGLVSIMFNIGKGSAVSTNDETKKIGGTLLGVELSGTIWATRNYWVGLNIGRKVGTLKEQEGVISNGSNSLSLSKFDLKFGYKYLPMGFFYGPQVDAFFGYSNYNYGLDKSVADGFTEVSFKGPLFGARGSIPIQRLFRAHLELSFLFSPSYTDADNLYGEDDSTSTYSLEVGGSYIYSPSMNIEFSYGVTSSTAKFENPVRSLKVKESLLKVGSSFTF